MQESNSEGVANHTGPEPCVVVRKGDGEARGQRPHARMESTCTGTGRCQRRLRWRAAQTASRSPRADDDDERRWEVGQPRSTREAAEQGRTVGRGGGGGKGAGQRKSIREQHGSRNASSTRSAVSPPTGRSPNSRFRPRTPVQTGSPPALTGTSGSPKCTRARSAASVPKE
jgi:hypothetical protein